MDWWIVKQLRATILTDLHDFIPKNYFEREADRFKLHNGLKNSAHYSREFRWGYLASKLGKRLFFESTIIMSAKQVSASELLMNLGLLAIAEAINLFSSVDSCKIATNVFLARVCDRIGGSPNG